MAFPLPCARSRRRGGIGRSKRRPDPVSLHQLAARTSSPFWYRRLRDGFGPILKTIPIIGMSAKNLPHPRLAFSWNNLPRGP